MISAFEELMRVEQDTRGAARRESVPRRRCYAALMKGGHVNSKLGDSLATILRHHQTAPQYCQSETRR